MAGYTKLAALPPLEEPEAWTGVPKEGPLYTIGQGTMILDDARTIKMALFLQLARTVVSLLGLVILPSRAFS
jgi:hypothetical protein